MIGFFISSNTYSEDVWIKGFENNLFEIMINKDSVRIVDDTVFILEKYILKNPSKQVNPCTIKYTEINCKSLMKRSLNIKFYNDRNCSVLDNEYKKTTDWDFFSPGSIGYKNMKKQCSYK